MNPLIYKVIHLLGIMGVFTAVSALIMQGASSPNRKPIMIVHGVAWFLVMLGGFGMLARYDIPFFHWWTLSKLAILVFFGAVPVLAKKGLLKDVPGWGIILAVGLLAAILGVFRIYMVPVVAP